MRRLSLFAGIAGAVLILLGGCVSTAPVRLTEHTVYCPPLKVTVTKPAGWSFVSLQDVRNAQKSVKTTNQGLNYRVYQDALAPFVTIERDHPVHSSYQPSLTIVRESLGEERLASSDKVAGFVLWNYMNVMSGAHALGPTVNVKIGGEYYSHLRIRYPLRVPDGRVFAVDHLVWTRSNGASAVIISASFDVKDAVVVEPEIRQILASIAPAEAPAAAM